MRNTIMIALLATTLAGPALAKGDDPARGIGSVNVPVVTRSDYMFDAAAPDGSLPSSEEARLDAWLRSQSETATFFLDSIDELELTMGSFEQALIRLKKAIAGQLGNLEGERCGAGGAEQLFLHVVLFGAQAQIVSGSRRSNSFFTTA